MFKPRVRRTRKKSTSFITLSCIYSRNFTGEFIGFVPLLNKNFFFSIFLTGTYSYPNHEIIPRSAWPRGISGSGFRLKLLWNTSGDRKILQKISIKWLKTEINQLFFSEVCVVVWIKTRCTVLLYFETYFWTQIRWNSTRNSNYFCDMWSSPPDPITILTLC